MSPYQQQPDAGDRIADAAHALAEGRVARPILPSLRQGFGLTAVECVVAIKAANRLRQEAHDG